MLLDSLRLYSGFFTLMLLVPYVILLGSLRLSSLVPYASYAPRARFIPLSSLRLLPEKILQPPGAVLPDSPQVIFIIGVKNPKAFGETIAPLEIIHQGPNIIALERN